MPLAVLPDALLIALKHLRAEPELQALVDERVYEIIPDGAVFPLVRVRRVGGVPVIPYRLDRARLQIEAWVPSLEEGGTEYQATQVARVAHAAIHTAPGAHDDGVVTSVEDLVGFFPDDDPETGRLRTGFEVAMMTRPL